MAIQTFSPDNVLLSEKNSGYIHARNDKRFDERRGW